MGQSSTTRTPEREISAKSGLDDALCTLHEIAIDRALAHVEECCGDCLSGPEMVVAGIGSCLY